MHIVLIEGSSRKVSQSMRIAQYLAGRLLKLEVGTSTDVVDLSCNPLPLWDETVWQKDGQSELQQKWVPYAKRLQAADGFVVVAPEWHGMVPPGLKNFFLFCTVKEVGHKPGLITTVSASRNGAYPVDELRISSYKNNRLCYIPEQIIVRDAGKIFEGDAPAGPDDAFLRDRADFALRILLDYATAMAPVRANPAIWDKKYVSGM